MNLDEHLNAAYFHAIGQSTGTPYPAFAEALKADPEMKGAAAARRASLNDDVCAKCFISRAHREALDTALRMAT